MTMFANHIDLTVDHCADTRFALARESRRTERSENEAGNVEQSLKPKLSEQTVQHERLRPHPILPVLIFCRYEKEISPMASPPRRSRVPVTRDARGMIPPSHLYGESRDPTFVFTSAFRNRCTRYCCSSLSG